MFSKYSDTVRIMMERFSPSYSENRVILMKIQCQACLTLAGGWECQALLGTQCWRLLSAFALSLVLSLQHPPGQLWDSETISHNLYITHHYFSSLGLPSLLRTVLSNPDHGSILGQQVLPVPHCLGLGRILTGMIFFVVVLWHAVHYSSPI